MNKVKFLLPLTILLSFLLYACEPIDDPFDEALLIGTWKSTAKNEFYRYDTAGTGVTWDTDDDVTEEEGQAFTWTLVKAELTHIHIMEMGGSGVPKIYTVTELTETSLKYKDDFNKTSSFIKM